MEGLQVSGPRPCTSLTPQEQEATQRFSGRPALSAPFCTAVIKTLEVMATKWGVPGCERDDLVQEVWLDLLPRLAVLRWRHWDAFRAWLRKVAWHKAIDLYRKRQRQQAASLEGVLRAGRQLFDHRPGPVAVLMSTSSREIVARALSILQPDITEQDHRVAVLRFLEGATIGEIAAAVALCKKQVRLVVHRLAKKLRGVVTS
jgi:RNA polymerase sigma factor (sigma-70 family)